MDQPSPDLRALRIKPMTEHSYKDYQKLITDTYEPLEFMTERAHTFMPRPHSECFTLDVHGDVVGCCSLTPLKAGSVFHHVVPCLLEADPPPTIELNNIILAPELRGDIGLSFLLYEAVKRSIELGYEVIVGLTRYETLRYFVDAGASPVFHEPLHLLDRDDLNDFIVFYDARSAEAKIYLEQRANRLLKDKGILRQIKQKLKADRQAA